MVESSDFPMSEYTLVVLKLSNGYRVYQLDLRDVKDFLLVGGKQSKKLANAKLI